jgi:predicted ester cyclase
MNKSSVRPIRWRKGSRKTHQSSCRNSRLEDTFYDVSAGKEYYGRDIGETVDACATAFPDTHRELHDLQPFGDLVLVKLSLNGTHQGDLVLPPRTIPPTGRKMSAPCCDVFHLNDGKIVSFHCYVAVPILLEQLGVFMNLQASFKR